MLADLGLYDTISEIAGECEYEGSCTQSLRTKILPFFFKYQPSYRPISHIQLSLTSELLETNGFLHSEKKLSFRDFLEQMTPE